MICERAVDADVQQQQQCCYFQAFVFMHVMMQSCVQAHQPMSMQLCRCCG